MANTDKNPQNGMQGSSSIYSQGASPNTRTAVSQKVRIMTPTYGDKVAMNQMGVLSSFNLSQSRNTEAVRGIGFGDKIAELVPGLTEPTTADCERALLYLSNLWQSTGYAGGIDGPVRSLAHHKWPFDVEEQLAFSSLSDVDLDAANVGYAAGAGGQAGQFDGGVKAITYPQVTTDFQAQPENRGHTAIITIYEAAWWTSWSRSLSKEQAVIMESGNMSITDVHDFASAYGEFMATGNDPTLGQLGSLRFAGSGSPIASAGGSIGGGSTQSLFSAISVNTAS